MKAKDSDKGIPEGGGVKKVLRKRGSTWASLGIGHLKGCRRTTTNAVCRDGQRRKGVGAVVQRGSSGGLTISKMGENMPYIFF